MKDPFLWFFFSGFAAIFAANGVYIFMLWTIQQAGHKVKLSLYGIQLPQHIATFLSVTKKNQQSVRRCVAVLLLVILPIVGGICLWQANRIESENWPQASNTQQ